MPTCTFLSSTVYSIIYDKHTSNKKVSPWITFVKILLCSLGFPEIWSSQSFVNAKWLVKAVNRKLTDMFIQNWTSKINIESKSNIYRIFKTTFEQSTFLNLLPGNLSKIFFKFRTRNHRFPVETGSWGNTSLNERLCNFCERDVGDEYHMILICPRFENERHRYLKRYYYRHPNTSKFEQLMNSINKKILIKICHLI